MQFSDELGRLVIQNMEIIETAPSVVKEVETLLFKAINERIKQRTPKGWSGVYDLVTEEEEEETTLLPKGWPAGDDGSYNAWYALWCNEAGSDLYWLSSATGVKGAALCLIFGFDYSHLDMNRRQYRAKLTELYSNSAILADRGFLLAQGSIDDYINIFRPFHLDARKLARELPDFDEVLAPLDEALDDLLEVHPVFDGFIKSKLLQS
ncbi:MAG: hypothetical protein NC211_08890 [Alistipes senegalensis]|nr:hypothetical protein [Oxalobacter formigenes]MCM1281923.1 hypothetical protein [Alistipes senegalensis]